MIEGEKSLSRNLTTLDWNLKNWRSEFTETGKYLQNFFAGQVFSTRGGVIGESWKPLSPAYAARKAMRYPGRGILEATGRMRGSFQYESSNMWTRVFNTVNYFKYHQSRMPRTRLPRRVMMKLDNQRKQSIVQIFHKGLDNFIRKSGFRLKTGYTPTF
ncbi:MAG: hypothetical protein COX19_14105 [Desulfobacterales bacterium CG23_combo_of_CG06-09_8_20_14_all_51_8]|nr:MAG: hypothetical protein COX19_14105 [Desulfobacterales bacterium CG23_combo_of_CG06-09_8_20_14_all_51_8]